MCSLFPRTTFLNFIYKHIGYENEVVNSIPDYVGLTLADGGTVGGLLDVAIQHKANDKPAITFGC